MTPFETLADSQAWAQPYRMQGVVVAIVTNNRDPENLARVKLKFPWLSDNDESDWARLLTPMAVPNGGFHALPAVGSEVLVAFEMGDLRFPYVLGSLWNQVDPPPKSGEGDDTVCSLRSRSGHRVTLDDKQDQGKIEIADRSGKNLLVFDTASNTITISAGGDIKLAAAQGTITLEARTIELKSSSQTRLESQGGTDVVANGTLTLKGVQVNIN